MVHGQPGGRHVRSRRRSKYNNLRCGIFVAGDRQATSKTISIASFRRHLALCPFDREET
jgi:hypothetical protein